MTGACVETTSRYKGEPIRLTGTLSVSKHARWSILLTICLGGQVQLYTIDNQCYFVRRKILEYEIG